jgi:AraC family transcriptional regulator, transcriptional activator of pobA
VHLVLRNAASSGCSLLFSNDYLPAELISNLPFSRECPILSLSKTDFSIVSGLIDTIKAEHTGKQDNYKSLIKAYMSALMNHLLRIYRIQYPESVRKSNLHPLIDSFHKLIGQHFAEHLTIEYYASQLNISAKHLIEICKEQTGKTALQHIKEHVVSEAKKLLFHSNLSIKEIAYKLGFDEPANFSKYFKSATSYTPVEYREGIR